MLEFRHIVTALDIHEGYAHVKNWLVIATGYQDCVSLDAFRCNGERIDKKNKIAYVSKVEFDWERDYHFYKKSYDKYEISDRCYLEFPTDTFTSPFDFYEHIGYDHKRRKFTGEKQWTSENH